MAVMGSNPSQFKGVRNPVEMVSWDDAKSFVGKLSAKTGESYRLLSESESEYTARSGSPAKYSFGDSEGALCDYSNEADLTEEAEASNWTTSDCSDGYGKKTARVGSYKANTFGVHDTVGNLWEWVEDCRHDSYSGAPSDGSAWTSGGECNKSVL